MTSAQRRVIELAILWNDELRDRKSPCIMAQIRLSEAINALQDREPAWRKLKQCWKNK